MYNFFNDKIFLMIILNATKGMMKWALVRMYNLTESNFAKCIKSLKFTHCLTQ